MVSLNNNIDFLYTLDSKKLSEMISDLKSNIRLLNNLIKVQEAKVNDLLFNSESILLENNNDICLYSFEHNKLDSLKREKKSLSNYIKKCCVILEEKSK